MCGAKRPRGATGSFSSQAAPGEPVRDARKHQGRAGGRPRRHAPEHLTGGDRRGTRPLRTGDGPGRPGVGPGAAPLPRAAGAVRMGEATRRQGRPDPLSIWIGGMRRVANLGLGEVVRGLASFAIPDANFLDMLGRRHRAPSGPPGGGNGPGAGGSRWPPSGEENAGLRDLSGTPRAGLPPGWRSVPCCTGCQFDGRLRGNVPVRPVLHTGGSAHRRRAKGGPC